MTHLLSIRCLASLLCVITLAGVPGCRQHTLHTKKDSGFEEFIPVYNRYIESWLKTQQKETAKALAATDAEITKASGVAAERLETHRKSLLRDQERWAFRLSLGDYFHFANPSTIPADLTWEDGANEPEIGDPAAKKGGVFRRYIDSFPPTIRPMGRNSNNSFRGDLYDYIDLTLVTMHPETMGIIPGVAKEWATSSDGRTTYFRIHPNATYSNGEPVHARDILFDVYLRVSDNIVNPYGKQYFRENFAQFVVYDEHTLSITLPEAKLYAAAVAGGITPACPSFYNDYGPDYDDRYQWRFPPTTGAYEVHPEDVIKGVSITQTRVQNWWARDMKYYRYRYNPNKVVHTVIRDESKAFELFRAGQLDTFLITRPDLWYEKTEMEPVYKGFIERVTFYNRYPKIPRGLYLNVIKPPLDNRDVRIGIDFSLNWQKVIDVEFRSDAQRLNSFNEGYGAFSDPSIHARPYSIQSARESFAKAGYTQEGRDGILIKPDGSRLSVAITYPSMPISNRILAILREDAKACGLELRLDGLEHTVSYKKEMQKQHDITLSSWMVTPPIPDFYQFLHSSNAFDDKGNPKTQTNNIFSWARADTDELCDKNRNARTIDEMKQSSWSLQNIMHDEAIFLPAYSVGFSRVGSWRWIKWPDCPNTRFCPPVVYDPHEVFVFWVDDQIKQETQAALRSGKSFPESIKTADAYRQNIDKPTTPEPPPSPKMPELDPK